MHAATSPNHADQRALILPQLLQAKPDRLVAHAFGVPGRAVRGLRARPKADAAHPKSAIIPPNTLVQRNRRRLPHKYPVGRALFITWHLHGSLPASRYPTPGKWSSGKVFLWADRYLDSTREGPLYLRDRRIAELVVRALLYAERELHFYDLHAYVLMANHVHLLVTPQVEPQRFLRSIKSHTAKEANRILGRTGEPFWQWESYDHWVRNDHAWVRIHDYIVNNPVRAGLVKRPEDWPWSSASQNR